MSKERFPITAAQLIGNFSETLFYGIYLATCLLFVRPALVTGSGLEERLCRPREPRGRWMTVVIGSLLFVICTFDVAIGLLHNFHAFIKSDNAEKEFLNLGDWINITRSCTQVAAMFIGDFVWIHRCWLLYDRRWLIVAPSIILWFAGIAMGVMFVQVEANPATDKALALSDSTALRWGMAVFAITAFQNALTTGMAILRLWRRERDNKRPRYSSDSLVRKVMLLLVGSGAAYTTMVLITFFMAVSRSNAIYPTSNMALISTGIVFNVIVVRPLLGRNRQSSLFATEISILEFGHAARSTSRRTTFAPINLTPKHSKVRRDVEVQKTVYQHLVPGSSRAVMP